MGPQPPADRLEAAKDLFSEALDLPFEERETFVRARCESDPDLAGTVLRLLSQFGRLGSFLERGPVSNAREGEFHAGDLLLRRFRILSNARKGGMGAVYQAEDTALGEIVGLKTVRPELANDEEALARFREEIRLARRIVHPNVCRIYDLFTDDHRGNPQVFFTMEWLEGETLQDRLREGALELETVLRIASAVANGLGAAHELGIVHRDLKPSNVILVRGAATDRIVVTDFGLARIFHSGETEDRAGNTRPGEIMGSPDYMAPEQFLGQPVSAATDVFALGVITYEMVAGKRPFPNETLIRTALRRISEAAPPVRRYRPEVAQSWQDAISKALRKNPLERQQSAKAFVEEMGAHRKRLPSVSLPSRRNLIKGGLLATSMAALIAYLRSREWEGKIPSQPVVMLTSITHSQASDLELAAKATDLLLATQLGQSSHTKVVGQDQVARAWRLMGGKSESIEVPRMFLPEVARQIALRCQAQFIVFGNLAQVGDERVLRIRLEWLDNNPRFPKKGWSRDFEAQGPHDLPQTASEAASWLRRTTGESAASLESHARRPEELTTASWEALKEFTQGNDAWRDGDAGSAILHLKTALQLDDQFAMAAARLADILMANGQSDDAYREWARAVSLLEKRNLTDRESLRTRGVFALDVGLNEAAEEVFSRYVIEYPNDPLPRFYKAASLNRLERTEQALEFYSQTIRMAPDNYAFVMGRAIFHLEGGRLREAEADWDRAARLNGRDWTHQIAMALAFAKGDIGEVSRRILRMRATGSAEFQSKSYALEGCLRAEQNRMDGAESALLEGIEFDRRTGTPVNARHIKQRLLAEVYLMSGNVSKARCVCGEILGDNPGYQIRLHVGCVLARCGDVSAARAVECTDLQQALAVLSGACGGGGASPVRRVGCERLVLPDWPIYAYWERRLESEMALAKGRMDQAANVIAAAPPPPNMHVFPDQLLRAAAAARNSALRDKAATLLTGSPGRWWIEPELNTAGFFSGAARTLGELGQNSRVSAIMAKLRA